MPARWTGAGAGVRVQGATVGTDQRAGTGVATIAGLTKVTCCWAMFLCKVGYSCVMVVADFIRYLTTKDVIIMTLD